MKKCRHDATSATTLPADAALAKLHFRWRTALIVRELEEEVCARAAAKNSKQAALGIAVLGCFRAGKFLFRRSAMTQVLALEKGRQHRQELKVIICSGPTGAQMD